MFKFQIPKFTGSFVFLLENSRSCATNCRKAGFGIWNFCIYDLFI